MVLDFRGIVPLPKPSDEELIDRILSIDPGLNPLFRSFEISPELLINYRGSAATRSAQIELMCWSWLSVYPSSIEADSTDVLFQALDRLSPSGQADVLAHWVLRGGTLWCPALSAQYLSAFDRFYGGKRHSFGFVYLMHGADGLFKIGHAKSPIKRLRQVQAAESLPVRLLACQKFEDRLTVEMDLHRRFASKRARGEWFSLDKSEVAAVIDALGGAVL